MQSGEGKVAIPKDLDTALKELDHMLDPRLREEMRKGTEGEMGKYHFGLGMWMRNNWGLWAGSELSQWFHKRGIGHPDDMSGILLTSYWRRLNGKPIDLEGQVKHYQAYWERAKGEAAVETRRAKAASLKIRDMMVGLKVDPALPPKVTVPKELDSSFRVRYAAPFQGGLLLTAKTFLPDTPRGQPDFTVRTAFLDLKTGILHPVKARGGERVEDAVVVGDFAYLNCGKRIVRVGKGARSSLPMPAFAAEEKLPVRLGVGYAKSGKADTLLAVGARDVARWNGKGWTSIWDGKLDLPPCALPAQRFGDFLYLRDEGSGEDNKRLFWIDLAHPGRPVAFDEHVGVVGSYGPRWENVWDYAVTPDGTRWISTNSEEEAASLLAWHPLHGYRVSLYHASPQWRDDLLGDDRKAPPYSLCALEPQSDGSLSGAGPSGLFTIRDRQIRQELRFDNVRNVFGIWSPSKLLTVGPNLKFLGDGFGGMILVRKDARGRTAVQPIGAESKVPKVW